MFVEFWSFLDGPGMSVAGGAFVHRLRGHGATDVVDLHIILKNPE